jgi:molybdenum cofactor cytidylyltransferase
MGQAVTRTFALLPAAGKSVRMGRPKLALPLGDRTVLECVVAVLKEAGIEHVLVVLGPHVGFLQVLAEKAGADVLLLPEATPDMRATVTHGLREIERRFQPTDEDRWLLLPPDHPTLSVQVLHILFDAARRHPEASIFLPTYQEKRGHPALISWRHVPKILSFPADRGLNQYFRQHGDQTCEVPVALPEVLYDLDTPEDYERLKRRNER